MLEQFNRVNRVLWYCESHENINILSQTFSLLVEAQQFEYGCHRVEKKFHSIWNKRFVVFTCVISCSFSGIRVFVKVKLSSTRGELRILKINHSEASNYSRRRCFFYTAIHRPHAPKNQIDYHAIYNEMLSRAGPSYSWPDDLDSGMGTLSYPILHNLGIYMASTILLRNYLTVANQKWGGKFATLSSKYLIEKSRARWMLYRASNRSTKLPVSAFEKYSFIYFTCFNIPTGCRRIFRIDSVPMRCRCVRRTRSLKYLLSGENLHFYWLNESIPLEPVAGVPTYTFGNSGHG